MNKKISILRKEIRIDNQREVQGLMRVRWSKRKKELMFHSDLDVDVTSFSNC